MINSFQDLQMLGQTGIDGYVRMLGEWNKSWQSIATEMSDYSKRTFEDGTDAFEKIASAKSLEQALEIQSSYMKHVYEDYMRQLSKIGSMYQTLAQEAFKPLEATLNVNR